MNEKRLNPITESITIIKWLPEIIKMLSIFKMAKANKSQQKRLYPII